MNKYLWSVQQFQQKFSFYRPIEVALLSCLGALNSFLEMLTVTAIIPLILLILSPEAITQGRILGFLYRSSGARSHTEFAIFLALGLIFLFTLKLSLGILIWRYEFNVLQKWQLRILVKLFHMIVHAKFSKIQTEDSSTIINILSSSIPYIVINLFYNLIILANTFLIFLFLLSVSFTYSFRTILIASLFGATLIYIFISYKNKRMRVLGEENQELSKKSIAILQKSIFGLKETKISLKQDFFADKYTKVSTEGAKKELSLQFIQNMPSLVIEHISMVTILLVFTFLLIFNNDVQQATSEIAILIFIGIRLIPLVNHVISSIVMMASCEEPVRTVLNFHDMLTPEATHRPEKEIKPLPFNHVISFRDVSFSYTEEAEKFAIEKISLNILKGQHIGFVGPSGAGKTTIVNIILGFLIPQSGNLLVDNQIITVKNINNLRKILSFVDQAPFLMNDTYINNIAYGEEEENIDLERVQSCLTKVGLWTHASNSPNGLEFKIGENGKFLSGGQKQRLAIARALYKNVQIIILDEASSSLDMDSEAQLSELIESLKKDVTIISIAHRLSTLKSCDKVFFIENGFIKAEGSFQELYKKSEAFERYIKHSNIEINKNA